MITFNTTREPDFNSQSWYDFYGWFVAYSKWPSPDEEWLKSEVEEQRKLTGSSVFTMKKSWSIDGKEHEYYDVI